MVLADGIANFPFKSINNSLPKRHGRFLIFLPEKFSVCRAVSSAVERLLHTEYQALTQNLPHLCPPRFNRVEA
jgi:hypothetical protein